MVNFGTLEAQSVLDSYNGLKSTGKYWSPGDRVLFVFSVYRWVNGKPDIPVAMNFGHSVDLGDDFKRSFLPTTSELDKNNQPIEKDFAYRAAGIMRALLQGEYELKKQKIEKEFENNSSMLKVELDSLEKSFDNRKPAIGGLFPRTYTEVGVAKLDVNGRLNGGEVKLSLASMNISPKKLKQLYKCIAEEGSCKEGDKYIYVVLNTSADEKKEMAAQNEWKAITDPEKRLEVLHPDFQEYAEKFFADADITSEKIGNRAYDFKPYDISQLKTAVANYVGPREHFLKDMNGNYFDFCRREDNVELLRAINLVASADTIQSLLNADAQHDNVTSVGDGGGTAQSFDIEQAMANAVDGAGVNGDTSVPTTDPVFDGYPNVSGENS